MLSRARVTANPRGDRSRAPRRRVLPLIAAAGCLGFIQNAGPVRLSADRLAENTVQGCLADASGVVARYTDDEPYAAVDPRNPSRVIAVWQTRSGTGSAIQWSRSVDSGKTWTAPRAAPINACAGGPVADAPRSSDPWVTFGPDGRTYLSAIAWKPNAGDGPDLVSALVVVASPDGGSTWAPPVAAAIAPSPDIAHDNLAITADPTRPGTVYAATTRAESPDTATYFGRLGFTRSDDGGRTWTAIRPITPAVNRERIGAPQIVVDPRSGRLYAVYHRRTRGAGYIGVMSSDDRGDTWRTESVAAAHIRGARPRHPVGGGRFVLADDIVQAVVSPRTGQLVIAYADGRLGAGQRHDVSIVWSTDGIRWSHPLAVSDSGPETAWLPAVAATATGEIGVSYFSADFTPAPPAADARARVLLQRFRMTGDSLTPIDRVVLDEAKLEWPGDYQSLVVVNGHFLAVYGRETDIVARLVAAGLRK